jgi:hypothetical protein
MEHASPRAMGVIQLMQQVDGPLRLLSSHAAPLDVVGVDSGVSIAGCLSDAMQLLNGLHMKGLWV